MNTERLSGIQRRARLHAALSDPTRLAIIETLALGDASPSELQATVHAPSNLLAHHLKVLDAEGLVVRRRSEADRRRTYLQLVPDAMSELVASATMLAPRVVFVCTANSARSQLAEALWRRASPVPVASAGTEPADRVDPGAIAVARRHQLPLAARRPQHVEGVLHDADIVITVCDNAHEQLAPPHALHWSIPDPVAAGTPAAFETAFDDLSRRIADLAPRLRAS